MRHALAFVLVLAAAVPSASAAPCSVHVLRAPDAVRARIEERVKVEPQCEATLDVRVVPTTEGLYLLAFVPGGRTYEMIVPDGETAAELIARWSAHPDGAAEPAEPEPGAPPGEMPVAAPVAPTDADVYAVPRVRPPGVTPQAERAPGSPAASAKAGRWVSVSAIIGSDGGGVRGDLDLWSRNGWSIGAALAYSEIDLEFESSPVTSTLAFADMRAVATLAYTHGRGPWRLRGQGALGVVHTRLTGFDNNFNELDYAGVHPIGDLGVQVQRTFGRGGAWAVTGGPALTIYSQTYRNESDGMFVASRALDISFLAGIRRRL